MIVFVYNHLIKSASNSLISEYAKKESSWKLLKEQTYNLDIKALKSLLIEEDEVSKRAIEIDMLENKSENNLMDIVKIMSFGNRFWDGLSKYAVTDDFLKPFSTDIWEISNKVKKAKNLNSRDISLGNKVLKIIEENNIGIEVIKEMSNETEKEIIDIKAVYDRLKLISKNDWNKIFDLGDQTKIYDALELSNLKSVFKSIIKDEIIKEINLIKALESVKKVSKFGLHF